jgi:aminobenzoyl-glutamate utilization protein B
MHPRIPLALSLVASLSLAPNLEAQDVDPRLEDLKEEALKMVEERGKLVQEIIDHLFSYGELGMQEFETQRYLTGLLGEEGFEIELGVAGMPSAWTARWSHGTGEPVIAVGSDVDGIPQSNQKPGVGYRDAMIPMAPGHGEGHNSGQAVNIVGALVVKELMERENLDGTILIWPGVAEEQVASKAFFVREGVFDGVDVNLFTHVSSNFGMSWGQGSGNALWSVQFRFRGETAHSAGSPWRGRSALDAVMLMAQAWEYKREHLQPAARWAPPGDDTSASLWRKPATPTFSAWAFRSGVTTTSSSPTPCRRSWVRSREVLRIPSPSSKARWTWSGPWAGAQTTSETSRGTCPR